LLVDIKETYKRILQVEPGALPGYVLPEIGHKRRTVIDPKALKIRLGDKLSPDLIDAVADYPIGKIEQLYGQATGLTGKKLAAEFDRLIANAIKITNDEPFIRPLNRRERDELKTREILNE
jgi:hypothetical protein